MCSQDFLIQNDELIRYLGTDTEVAVPNTVKMINKGAFYNCTDVTSVTLPDGLVEIEQHAFHGCSRLVTLTIPRNVMRIGYWAFQGCAGLTEIKVCDQNPEYSTDENGALYDKEKRTLICFPPGSRIADPVVAQGVWFIGTYAFGGCTNLKKIRLPDSLCRIDNEAFFGCEGLTEIHLPEGLEEIGYDAFCRCASLTSVVIPDKTWVGKGAFAACKSLTEFIVSEQNRHCSVDEFGVLFDKQKETLISYPIGNTRTDYTIPDGVREIMRFAFLRNAHLTSVTLPVSLKQVCWSAFRRCGNLRLVRYHGTEEQFKNIDFARGNEDLLRTERIVCG